MLGVLAHSGPLDAHVYALVTAGDDLFAGLGDGTLLQSADGGDSWTELADHLPDVLSIRAAVLGSSTRAWWATSGSYRPW